MKALTGKWLTMLPQPNKKVLTVIDVFITPKFELAVWSKNGPSGPDATLVIAEWEHGERIGISSTFEYVSERKNTFQEVTTKEETRKKILDEVSDLSVVGTLFSGQSYPHHMVTRQSTGTNQSPEFLKRRTLTQHDPASHQHQNLSTHV